MEVSYAEQWTLFGPSLPAVEHCIAGDMLLNAKIVWMLSFSSLLPDSQIIEINLVHVSVFFPSQRSIFYFRRNIFIIELLNNRRMRNR